MNPPFTSPAPEQVTDWQRVAMFFADVVVADHPDWVGHVLQVIQDCTKEVGNG